MSIKFEVNDVLHQIIVKFVNAFLPESKKEYNLRVFNTTTLDEHALASKGDVYSITVPPAMIESGLSAAEKIILYSVADGFKVRTKLFTVKIRLPGEYNGTETSLAEGAKPEVNIQPTAFFNRYIAERVTLKFDGVDTAEGFIAEAIDEATGLVDEAATMGNILTIHGMGLKIAADEAHKIEVGAWLKNVSTSQMFKLVVAVNEPRTLKLVVPVGLATNASYILVIRTQASVRNPSHLLKETREMESNFALHAIN